MIFLSAQPDEIYFLWQLELQLFNFARCGISPEQIHVLIGYDPRKGLSPEFANLIQYNRLATFFTYPNERRSAYYPPSIRPHIVKQHYKRFPELQLENMLYHDSDIIFRQLPDFSKMNAKGALYVSDTKKYLDTEYIKTNGSSHLLDRMCNAVGVSRYLIEKTDDNAGGAQLYFTAPSVIGPSFWDKLERDAETLFDLMERHNASQEYNTTREVKTIQSWCSDMWAILWNAILYGIPVIIHKELDFCWPTEDLTRWQDTKILHLAGVTKKDKRTLFYKTEFTSHTPYYEQLDQFGTQKCSKRYIDLIRSYREEVLYPNRIDLSDTSFLIPMRIDSQDRLDNLYILIRYLEKHFITNIIVLEADSEPRFTNSTTFENVRHIFIRDDKPLFHRTRYNNQLINHAHTPVIAIYDCDVILPVQQLVKAVDAIRSGTASVVSPYDGRFIAVDKLFKLMMEKLLDAELLEYNINKFLTCSHRSYGGTTVLNKEHFIEAGADNEHLTSWGPEDIERIRRMDILGYTVKRIPGPLYHLPHARHINSGYPNVPAMEKLMGEYLKVCSSSREELQEYIRSWPWRHFQPLEKQHLSKHPTI